MLDTENNVYRFSIEETEIIAIPLDGGRFALTDRPNPSSVTPSFQVVELRAPHAVKVVYTFDNSTKASSHIQFIQPGSDQADAVRNVLLKYKLADEEYPHKPTKVAALVAGRAGRKFTANNHAQAWHLYKARPRAGSKQPGNTRKEYCIYHAAHRDYTYSDKWVEFLATAITDDAEFAKILATKL